MMLGNKILFTLSIWILISGSLAPGQTPTPATPRPMGGPLYSVGGGTPVTVEFISPVVTEFVPNAPGAPLGDCWEVIIEASINQSLNWPRIGVMESFNFTPPGLMGPLPTDVNGDAIMGDPNPFFPDLFVSLDEPFQVAGVIIPAGTNLASLFHKAGSEKELDATQTTTFAMTVDPQFMVVIDTNGDNMATLFTKLKSATDSVRFQFGMFTGNFGAFEPAETPTISFFTPDWISTVSMDGMTQWALGIEVRIQAEIQGLNALAYDPLPGPFMPMIGMMSQIQTGFSIFPGMPGMPNPNYPTLVLVFSDDFMDLGSGMIFTGGTINGCIGGNPANLRVTGQNLATLIQEVGVTWWYGVDGLPDNPFGPEIKKDDQLIYRFVFLVNGHIMDTDVLPNEMMATAGIVTYQGLSSVTNVRIKHSGQIMTPDPQP
ncbi:MAG: hypothetical protein ABIK28_02165 [Planctomycetota bacterium]